MEVSSVKKKAQEQPFPWLGMIAICFGMLGHSVVFTSPMPYVAFMVLDFKMTDHVNQAGYYAGYITGMFMVGRVLASVGWGMASDRWGRRPCLVISMFNIAFFGLLFGFSTNFYMAVTFRFMLGLGNGFMAIAKTVISEITLTKEHELRAFGWLNGIFGFGMIVGPTIGGLLARPHVQYPAMFHEDSIFAEYPYLLPNLTCSAIGVIAMIMLMLFIPETMHDYPTTIHTGSSDTSLTQLEDGSSPSSRGKQDNMDVEMIHIHSPSSTTNSSASTVSTISTAVWKPIYDLYNLFTRANNEGNMSDFQSLPTDSVHDSNTSIADLKDFPMKEIDPATAFTIIGDGNEDEEYNNNDSLNSFHASKAQPIADVSSEVASHMMLHYETDDDDCTTNSGTNASEEDTTLNKPCTSTMNGNISTSNTAISATPINTHESEKHLISHTTTSPTIIHSNNVNCSEGIVINKDLSSSCSSRSSMSNSAAAVVSLPSTPQEVWKDTSIRMLAMVYFALAVFILFVDENVPLWLVTSVEHGGLAWEAKHVGFMLALQGAGTIIYQFTAYEYVMSKWCIYGGVTTVSFGILIPAIFAAIAPFSVAAAQQMLQDSPMFAHASNNTQQWVLTISVLWPFLIYRCAACSAFSTLSILTNAAVSKKMRGTVNGLMMLSGSLGNAIGPIIGSIVYASLLSLDDSSDSSTTTEHHYHQGFRIDGRGVFLIGGVFGALIAFIVKFKLKVNAESATPSDVPEFCE